MYRRQKDLLLKTFFDSFVCVYSKFSSFFDPLIILSFNKDTSSSGLIYFLLFPKLKKIGHIHYFYNKIENRLLALGRGSPLDVPENFGSLSYWLAAPPFLSVDALTFFRGNRAFSWEKLWGGCECAVWAPHLVAATPTANGQRWISSMSDDNQGAHTEAGLPLALRGPDERLIHHTFQSCDSSRQTADCGQQLLRGFQ